MKAHISRMWIKEKTIGIAVAGYLNRLQYQFTGIADVRPLYKGERLS